MEQNNQATQENNNEAVLTNLAIKNLQGSVPWMKFLSVMGFILTGIMALSSVFMLVFGSSMPTAGGFMLIYGIIYLVLTVIFFFINFYLFRYASNVSGFYFTKDSLQLEKAFKMQKIYWTIKGVLLIVYLALIIITAIVVVTGTFMQLGQLAY